MNRVTSSDEASTVTRRAARPAVRAGCQRALNEINKADKNCPILFNKLTFNIISHCITTQKNKKGVICPRQDMCRFGAA